MMRQLEAHRAWAVLQRIMAAVMLLVASPLLLLLYPLVRLESPGPFLFRQRRIGRGGRAFTIFKIRTLSQTSDPVEGISVGDARITRLGRVLRASKLDELPQVINVLRGEMLLVGPRPLPEALDARLEQAIPLFTLRRHAYPGLTSFAQIATEDGHSSTELVNEWKRRARAERHYLSFRSVSYDLVVLLLTAITLPIRMLPARRERSHAECTLIAGIPVANVDYAKTLSRISSWIEDERGHRFVGVCPAHSIVDSLFDPDHRKALLSSDFNVADGMGVVWAQKVLGHTRASRVYGPELMLRLLAQAEAHGHSVGLYGGHPDRLVELEKRLIRDYPRLRLVLSISPPFGDLPVEEEAALVERIQRADPDLLFVGIGSPRQEKWMARNRPKIRAVMLGVGAAFDFHANAVPQAPRWVQRIGMEWAFRLLHEPRRLWRRYARANTILPARVLSQLALRALHVRSYQAGHEASRRKAS